MVLECGDTHWNMVNLPGGLKKMDSPPLAAIYNQELLSQAWSLVGPLLILAGMLTALTLGRSCAGQQSCSEFMSVAALAHPGGTGKTDLFLMAVGGTRMGTRGGL